MTAPELVKRLDGRIAALREQLAECEAARRLAMRRRVEEFEAGVVAKQIAATGELVRWLESVMGTAWESQPADDMQAAVKKFVEEAKAKQQR